MPGPWDRRHCICYADQAVRHGMAQVAAARTFGANLRAVSKWVDLDRSRGLRALTLKRRSRRVGGGCLSGRRAVRILALIVGRMPDQLKLPFYLWTWAVVAALIRREYGLEVSLVTARRYLKAWGMSPQKPVRLADERNDAALARWLTQHYPAIARKAKRKQAVIYWGNEMRLRQQRPCDGPQ